MRPFISIQTHGRLYGIQIRAHTVKSDNHSQIQSQRDWERVEPHNTEADAKPNQSKKLIRNCKRIQNSMCTVHCCKLVYVMYIKGVKCCYAVAPVVSVYLVLVVNDGINHLRWKRAPNEPARQIETAIGKTIEFPYMYPCIWVSFALFLSLLLCLCEYACLLTSVCVYVCKRVSSWGEGAVCISSKCWDKNKEQPSLWVNH